MMLVFIGLSTVKGQYVTINDPTFLTWLQGNYPGCMNGNQMDTTCSAILNTTVVDLSSEGYALDIYGIQYFKNATSLNCSWNGLTTLGMLPPNLVTLNCSQNMGPLTTITMFPSSLTSINCNDNTSLTALPTLPTSLISLDCSYDNITSLPALPNG